MVSGHGCFRAYLHRFKHEDSPECPFCPEFSEDAEHVFFTCPRFDIERRTLENVLKQKMGPDTLDQMMVSSKTAWEATSSFATDVLQQLRCSERERAKTRSK
ncbi:unnamed protein product [Euphydryas editha]|uniref:Reverse transcriptase n=1 Tax=Euphydryas editha TaxID=104508 RepID=A0AAU9TYU9_EUPED|nr:unnamed protein product [Euphydryas editha]